MSWREFGNLAIVGVAVLSAIFALLYAFMAPWYRSAMGRSLFSVLISLAIGVAYFGWAIFHSPLPSGFFPLRALIFTTLAVSIGASVILLGRAQIQGRPTKEVRNDLEHARKVDPGSPWGRPDGSGGGIPGRGRQRGDSQ